MTMTKLDQPMQKILIFDADDTLWDNNRYFERAIEEFLDLVAFLAPDRRAVRSLLSEVEKECIPVGGYGTKNFIRALRETFRRLYHSSDGHGYLAAIEEIGTRLLHHPIQPRPAVASTLQILQFGHRLLVFTKGDPAEQTGKLERSGLKPYFERMEIVPEKDVEAYRELIRRCSLDPEQTYMIGNSPRSDIVPALEAGLWAVFIPHPNTWELEQQEVPPHSRLLHAQSIRALPPLLSFVNASPSGEERL